YNFATAVDDAALKISHVIRAEEHLSNTPIQVLIHRFLDNPLPQWAHVPYVAAPGSKEKLSKRKIAAYRTNPQFRKLFELGDAVLSRLGVDPQSDALSPVMVEYYRRTGFLPSGVLNALARLGWSLDDHTEIMSLETVARSFTLDRVIRSAAGLDPDKLLSFQSHWMQQLSEDERVAGCLPFLVESGLIADADDPDTQQRVRRVVQLAGERLRVFGDIFQMDEFFVADDQIVYDEKNFQKRVVRPENALDVLRRLRTLLADEPVFTAERLHDVVQGFVTESGLKIGDVFPALRLCATGKAQGADLFPALELLGQNSVLARIDRALGIASQGQGP
ncbi:MAG: glutamate--tRNA ligase, partial [Planctomycetaceae bacterium]|nr:glutamate--tRNA ligase [Planctomycetaceae bacterium]